MTNNNSDTRRDTLNGLTNFLKFYEINDYKPIINDYKENNRIKRKQRNTPSSRRIIEVYESGFIPKRTIQFKHADRLTQWQFLYALLATYGLRIHEAWHIANWDKPVTLKNGDWVTIDIDDENSIEIQRDAEGTVIPAILDPDNTRHILCIKHATKTGYRMAMPISPREHNWIEEFSLLQPLNLPDIKEPLKRRTKEVGFFNCTQRTCRWFYEHEYGFTPHDLRHSYNHRGHLLGINPKTLADSLGHSMQMNSNNYLRHMSDNVKLKGMKEAIDKETETRSRVETLEIENEALKAENKDLLNEIELLKKKLQLNETYRESKGQK